MDYTASNQAWLKAKSLAGYIGGLLSDVAKLKKATPGSSAWGSITGTLSAQTDLSTALNGKADAGRTINGHALTSDVTVTASDVSAIPTSYLDTDGTLAGNSDTKIASQKATKTYVDAHAGSSNPVVAWTHGLPLPTDDGTNAAGYTHRQRITNPVAGGTQIRVKLQGHSTGTLVIDHVAAGLSGGNGDTTATPVELLFGGVSGCTVPAGGSIWSDWGSLTTNGITDILVIMDVHSSGTQLRRYDSSYPMGTSIWYKAATASYNVATVSGSGYGNLSNVMYIVVAIQVK